MTKLEKVVVRSVDIPDARKPDHKRKVVIYLQPNGILIFREFHGRKRYAVSLGFCYDRAIAGGPVGVLFEDVTLETKAKMKRKRFKGPKNPKDGGECPSEGEGPKVF